jgi:lipase chaperone LimK
MDQGNTAASRGGAHSGRTRALACGAIGVTAIAVFAFLIGRAPVSERDANYPANNSTVSPKERGLPGENKTEQNRSYSISSPNRIGANAGKPISAPTALLQTPSLHRLIEDLIGDAIGSGSIRSDPHGFRERLAARAKAHFPPELAQSAVAFLNRYVDYLESLDALNLSSAKSDVAALRSLFEERKALRESFFAPEEYKALFAREDRLDRYTIARMEIEANAKLSAEERDQALANAANELTPDERAERKSWQLHLNAQSQTALFDAKQTSDDERFEARKTEYGEAAAQRLAELDRSERDWQSRLAKYEQTARDVRNGALTNAQLDAARDQLFTAQEQLRLDAALAMRKR